MNNRSMPKNTLIPVLAYPNIEEAISWFNKTFGFTLRLKIGSHRAQININEKTAFAITKDEHDQLARPKSSIMIRITNLDSHYKNISKQNIKIISKPTDYPFGERQYSVEDLAGYVWTFSQTISDEEPESWGGESFNI